MKVDPILKSLETLTPNHQIGEIRQVFDENTIRISSIINSTPLEHNIKILKNFSFHSKTKSNKDFYKLGINRKYQDNTLILEITDEFPEFFPIFLMREVYLRFIPFQLKQFKFINIFINQFIQEDLSHLKLIEKWRSFVQKQVLDKKLLDAHMDRIDKLFKMKENSTNLNSRTFFFEYVRRNVKEIREEDEEFYEKLYHSYVFERKVSLHDEEVLKTIRDLFNIFKEVKSYSALLDYKRYFQDFKNDQTLMTDLSLTKFIDNVKWISNFTHIAPNYDVKWETFNFRNIACLLIFNPGISPPKIIKIVKAFPFFTFFKFTFINFSINIFGYFLLPDIYINDLKNTLNEMKHDAILLDFLLISRNYKYIALNLNYFKKVYEKGYLINLQDKEYNEDFLLISTLNAKDEGKRNNLSYLDFLILDRVRYFSFTGLPFERRSETIRLLKDDFSKKTFSEMRHLSTLKNNSDKIRSDQHIKQEIIKLLDMSFKANYFNIRNYLTDFMILREFFQTSIKQDKNINNINDLLELINQKKFFTSFHISKLLKNEILKRNVVREFSFTSFLDDKVFKKKTKLYEIILNFLDSCYAFKINDNLTIRNLVNNEDDIKNFIQYKQDELKNKFKKKPIYDLNSDSFEDKVEDFTTKKPLMLFPCMITTLVTTPFVSKTYYILILKNQNQILSKISSIQSYFPKLNLIVAENNLIFFDFYLPTIKKEEKFQLFLAIFTLFKDKIIYFNRLFTSGLFEPFDVSDHYDFIRKEYHYSKSLFPQFLKFVKHYISGKRAYIKKFQYLFELFKFPESSFQDLTEMVHKRISSEEINFNLKDIIELQQFHTNLYEYFLGKWRFEKLLGARFFKLYTDKISFIPNFSAFGLSQYFLYIKPIDLTKIDFKLLLSNTFQKVESIASIEDSPTFLIKYLFPYKNANKTYINRIVKVEKNASEYCLFSIEDVHQILHFEKNLSSKGWDPNTKISELFKLHAQNVLFEPQRRMEELNIKSYSLSNIYQIDIHGADSVEFAQLMEIYSIGAINLKKFMNDINFFKKIQGLISKNLLFFHLRLRNLDLKERLTIILPNVEEKNNNILLNIFSFFNYCFIYKIEGEFYIRDSPKSNVKEFNNGLMIKLRLPPLELSNLRESFSEIFEVLGIEHYLIFTDLIDFSFITKQLYPDVDFSNYNPLNNLKWDKRYKKWRNVKLYGDDVTKKIYPSIL